MNARSALFDLYGDHLRTRKGEAAVSALVRLLAPLDIKAPAVRTAVSRMVRQGWLEPTPTDTGPGYAMTPRAWRRLDRAATRIYRTREGDWDKTWHVLVLDPISNRSARERVRSALTFLGYAPLADNTWTAAYRSDEVDTVLAAEQAQARGFTAEYAGDARQMVRELWDLDALSEAYADWLDDARDLVDNAPAPTADEPDDETAFAVRSQLIHEWRKFLFRDPGLPAELLPDRWPGAAAAEFFDAQAARLMPGASRFVDHCLENGRPT
ncbi:MAG TPA: PaaX family transcriptional regulator C-terminal domain-containing protein [Nocardioidaceae bacterium]|nr:PaaX family transcriptional regulator C-terminal domain-containing protein [Nocardioidaceae bacterium]